MTFNQRRRLGDVSNRWSPLTSTTSWAEQLKTVQNSSERLKMIQAYEMDFQTNYPNEGLVMPMIMEEALNMIGITYLKSERTKELLRMVIRDGMQRLKGEIEQVMSGDQAHLFHNMKTSYEVQEKLLRGSVQERKQAKYRRQLVDLREEADWQITDLEEWRQKVGVFNEKLVQVARGDQEFLSDMRTGIINQLIIIDGYEEMRREELPQVKKRRLEDDTIERTEFTPAVQRVIDETTPETTDDMQVDMKRLKYGNEEEILPFQAPASKKSLYSGLQSKQSTSPYSGLQLKPKVPSYRDNIEEARRRRQQKRATPFQPPF